MPSAARYLTVRGCFSERYLAERLPDTQLWNAVDERAVAAAESSFRDLYDDRTAIDAYDQAELRTKVVEPALDILGVRAVGRDASSGEPADAESTSGRGDRPTPEYLLYERGGTHDVETGQKADAGPLAVADFVPAGRPHDAPDGRDPAPSYRLSDAVEASGVDHGVLTDGRRWRRYYAPACRRLDSYYEIDLPALLDARDATAFRYFYCFFGRESFGSGGGGGGPDAGSGRNDASGGNPGKADSYGEADGFVAQVHEGNREFVETLLDDLVANAREAVVAVAAELLAADERDDAEAVARVRDAALTVVVRLLLARYAEPERNADELIADRLGRLHRSERPDRSFGPFGGEAVDGEIAALLRTRTVSDDCLSEIADSLTTRETMSGECARVDLSSLSGRHLGRLYERLLEYDLAVADEPMVSAGGACERWRPVREAESASDREATRIEAGNLSLTTGAGTRKSSGSYYTPEPVVEYAVERALEPLVEGIRADLDPTDPAYAAAFEARVWEANVLDPAMGSGHFLAAAAAYLGRAVVRAQRRQVELSGAESLSTRRDVCSARRAVARHCLYGVDSDPLAVELASVSLGLATRDADGSGPEERAGPRLAHGNSLVGCRPDEYPTGQECDRPSDERAARDESTTEDAAREDATRRRDAMADAATARQFEAVDLPDDAAERLSAAVDDASWREITREPWFERVRSLAAERAFFHWSSAFPGVFEADERGFDAVVGNPPYVRNRALDSDLKAYCREAFRTATGAYDLYVPFVELACDLGRRASLVVPNKWTTTEYGRDLRDLLLDDHSLREILDASARSVFADANVYPVVVTVDSGDESENGDGQTGENGESDANDGAGETPDDDPIRVRTPGDSESLTDAPARTVPRSLVDRVGGRVVPLDLDPAFADLAEGVLDRCSRLGDHVRTSEAIHTGNARETLVTDERDGEACRRLVAGGSVDRYRIEWDGRWIRYDESRLDRDAGEYADFRDPGQFEDEKLLVRDISERPVAAFDDEAFYALNTLYTVREREASPLPLRYLLGVFNSTFVARYFRQVYGGTHVSGDYLRFKPGFTDEIPVPEPDPQAVSPPAVAADAGIDGEPSDDPPAAISELTDRLRALRDERATIDASVFAYLPETVDGPLLGEWADAVTGVGESVLAETAREREGLRVGTVEFERDGDPPVLAATARYRPAGTEAPTDRWGLFETESIPALQFPGGEEREAALLASFVPAVVERADGVAGFRENATKTNSPLDRLRAIRLPDPNASAVIEAFERYREAHERAARLDAAISRLDDAVDALVYRLYGLDDDEIAAVEALADE